MIHISIGSNLGNRLENVRNATHLLKKKVFNAKSLMSGC